MCDICSNYLMNLQIPVLIRSQIWTVHDLPCRQTASPVFCDFFHSYFYHILSSRNVWTLQLSEAVEWRIFSQNSSNGRSLVISALQWMQLWLTHI